MDLGDAFAKRLKSSFSSSSSAEQNPLLSVQPQGSAKTKFSLNVKAFKSKSEEFSNAPEIDIADQVKTRTPQQEEQERGLPKISYNKTYELLPPDPNEALTVFKQGSLSSDEKQIKAKIPLVKNEYYYVDRLGDKDTLVYGGLYERNIPAYQHLPSLPIIGLNKSEYAAKYHGINKGIEIVSKMRTDNKDIRNLIGLSIQKFKLTPPLIYWRHAESVIPSPMMGGFIKLEEDHVDEEVDLDSLRTVEDLLPPEILLKLKEFNKALAAHPKNSAIWIEFIKFHKTTLIQYYPNKKSLNEKLTMIFEKALTSNPVSVSLKLEYYQFLEAEAFIEPEVLKNKWESLLLSMSNQDPQMIFKAWMIYLRYCETSIKSFNDLLSIYLQMFQVLEETKIDSNSILCVIERLTLRCKEAGYTERALAILIANLEWNFLYRTHSKRTYLNEYWEACLQPHIGMHHLKVESPSQDPFDYIDTLGEERVVSNMSFLWAKVESRQDVIFWRPNPPSSSTEYPESIVLADDIKYFIIKMETNEHILMRLLTVIFKILGFTIIDHDMNTQLEDSFQTLSFEDQDLLLKCHGFRDWPWSIYDEQEGDHSTESWIESVSEGHGYYKKYIHEQKRRLNVDFPFDDSVNEGLEFQYSPITRWSVLATTTNDEITREKIDFLIELLMGMEKAALLEHSISALLISQLLCSMNTARSIEYLSPLLKEHGDDLRYGDALSRLQCSFDKKIELYRSLFLEAISNNSSFSDLYLIPLARSWMATLINDHISKHLHWIAWILMSLSYSEYSSLLKSSQRIEEDWPSDDLLISVLKAQQSNLLMSYSNDGPFMSQKTMRFKDKLYLSSLYFCYGMTYMLLPDQSQFCTVFTEFSQDLLQKSAQHLGLCELIAKTWIQLCNIYILLHPVYKPSWYRSQCTSVLKLFPCYWPFWKAWLALELKFKMDDRVQKWIDFECKDINSPVFWMIRIYTIFVEYNKLNVNTVLSLLEKAVEAISHFEPFWMLYIQFLAHIDHSKTLEMVIYRALNACPWSKSRFKRNDHGTVTCIGLYIASVQLVSKLSKSDRLKEQTIQMMHTMVEKELRVHLLLEEVEAYCTDEMER